MLTSHPSLSANDALSEEDKDGYWTLIAYHNSIRELGATLSAAHDDIDARLDYIAPLNNRRPLSADVIRELSSKVLDWDPAKNELILENKEGLLFDLNQPSLLQNISNLRNNMSLCKDISENAINRVQLNNSIDVVAEKIDKDYRNILQLS